MKYQPHRYVNVIRERPDRYQHKSIFIESSRRESDIAEHPLFDTWEEAHRQLIEWRRVTVMRLQQELTTAQRHLKRAQAMTKGKD